MNCSQKPVSLLQASQNHPTLAQLMASAQQSNARLQAILPLMAPALRANLRAGCYCEGRWTVLLTNHTTLAKARQLLPAWQAHLQVKGLPVQAIRLKVLSPTQE